MPYCPECKEEFREEITQCSECNVALVEALEEEAVVEMDDLARLCTVQQEEDAHIIRGYLENVGIPCQLENESFHAYPATALTKVLLWIRKSDLERAKAIMAELEKYAVCSACGHVVNPEDTVCDFCEEPLERSTTG